MHAMSIYEICSCTLFLSRVLDGRLDVHPSRSAIVVFYEVEAVVLTEFGEPVATDRKESRKM